MCTAPAVGMPGKEFSRLGSEAFDSSSNLADSTVGLPSATLPSPTPSTPPSSTDSSAGQKGSSSSTGMVAGIAAGVAGAAVLAAAAAGILLLRQRRKRRSRAGSVGKPEGVGSESKGDTPRSNGMGHPEVPFGANGSSRRSGDVVLGSAFKPSNGAPRVALEAVLVPGGVPGSQTRPFWGGTAVAPSGEGQ